MLDSTQLFLWTYSLFSDVWPPLLLPVLCSRPSEERTIPLSLIAEKTKLSLDDVEHLLIKSLSVCEVLDMCVFSFTMWIGFGEECVRTSQMSWSLCFWKCNRKWIRRCLYKGLPKTWGGLLYTYLTPLLGADELSLGSHCSLLLLFMLKAMVRHFVSDS
jgi:hypothetical protein